MVRAPALLLVGMALIFSSSHSKDFENDIHSLIARRPARRNEYEEKNPVRSLIESLGKSFNRIPRLLCD